jgi:hypothetical protein
MYAMAELKHHLIRRKESDRPLANLQQYLVELEVCLGLLRKVLLELKEVAFVVVMILFFIWSAVQLFKGIH